MMRNRLFVLLLIAAFVVTGCETTSQISGLPPTQTLSIPQTGTTPTASAPGLAGRPSVSPQSILVTDTPALPTATATPQPTSTPPPTPTPSPHPMSILALRQASYPGSDIIIENKLADGGSYYRYYASYLSEGLKIYALLTVPFGDPPSGGWPGIVFNHGYIPPTQYRTTERYVAYVDYLARSGYVVFRIDYRGHDRSEGEASGAYGDPGYLVDVLNAVSSLQRYPQVNPQKIGMWGHSMGGYLTLRAMVVSKEIKAGVIWGGVVASYPDLITKWRRNRPTPTPGPDSSGRRWRNEWLETYGTPDENPDFWNSISANSYLADLSGPLQLHHSIDDEEVPVEFSETLYAELQAAGISSELYTYKNDNHNISNNFTLAMSRTVEWFDRYLKGDQ